MSVLKCLNLGQNVLKVFPSAFNVLINQNNLHTTSKCDALASYNKGPKKWLRYNRIIYPPQEINEEPRPAFVCHMKTNIKYSPWKMWYIACMIRGLTVDEALKQLKFVKRQGAQYISEAIKEAKEMAVNEHNVEHASNLWVAESFVGKGPVLKGIRRHARARFGRVEYFYCHYFLRLEEGKPPKEYYQNVPKAPEEQLENWLQEMRSRKIINSL